MLRYKIWEYLGTSFWSIKEHNFGVLRHIIWEYEDAVFLPRINCNNDNNTNNSNNSNIV
jgi:hypothetical protein